MSNTQGMRWIHAQDEGTSAGERCRCADIMCPANYSRVALCNLECPACGGYDAGCICEPLLVFECRDCGWQELENRTGRCTDCGSTNCDWH